jgi:hypothetical protein
LSQQTAAPTSPTTANSVLGGPTTPSVSQTTRDQEAHGPVVCQVSLTSTSTSQRAEPSGPTKVAGGSIAAGDSQTMSRGGPTASSYRSGPSSGVDVTSSPATMEEDTDDDLLDYEPSPAHNGMEVNVVYLSTTDYSLLEEEEVLQLPLGPQDAIFKKLAESEDHLKSLYIRGHLNGMPVARMLVDGGAAVNVMPYSTFKKLEKTDAELVKMNMTLTGIRGDGSISPKGVTSMELTVESKMIPTAFFITEVQGNYNTILGHDWIHASRCVPSTLDQFLVQWVGEEVEIVHADVSACIPTADSSSWSHYNIKCLSGQDISNCDFVSASMDGFIPAFVKPIDDWLNLIM